MHILVRGLCRSFLGLSLCVQGTALAQEPAGAAPLSAPGALSTLDTVRLKDGSLYRGTLLEHSPGGHAVLMLHDGSKREFTGDVVAEVLPGSTATPAAAALPAAAPAPAAEAKPLSSGKLRLHVRTPNGYELSARKTGEGTFEPVCTTECDTRMAAGSYEFKLAHPHNSNTWLADGYTDLRSHSNLNAKLASRRGSRIAGGVVLGLGVITGVTLFGVGLKARADEMKVCRDSFAYPDCKGDAEKTGRPLIAVGVVTALVSAIVGGVLAARKDRFEVQETPLSDAETPPPPSGEAPVQLEPPSDALLSLTPVSAGPVLQEAEAAVRDRKDAIQRCIRDMPATAEFRIHESGAIGALRIFGDLEPTERECLWDALSQTKFPAGGARAVSVDIQPALR